MLSVGNGRNILDDAEGKRGKEFTHEIACEAEAGMKCAIEPEVPKVATHAGEACPVRIAVERIDD